jgi:hypothetical protein
MTDTPITNYPDILGYITGGMRCNINVVQLALAVRPRVVRAGRPFETILLVQNASDVDVDVTASLTLPEVDAKKQKGRFLSKKNRLLVGIRPAEVGYVVLPMSCLPDTAVSDSYKIEMEINVKPLKKPARIRTAEGGGEVVLDYLRDEPREKVEELKKLVFSTTKRFGLRDVLEASFSVMPGKIGQMVDFQPGWVNLWHMTDYVDERLVLEKYGQLLTHSILPRLKKAFVLDALIDTTQKRFASAGYPLQPLESLYIGKLLTLILEMAEPMEETFDYLGYPVFNIAQTVKNGFPAGGGPRFPHWCSSLLEIIAQDEKKANADLVEIVTETLYDDLLRDAIPYAFQMIRTVTGEDLGSEAEVQDYTENMIEMLGEKSGMDFTHVYMPLVIGGVIIYDRIISDAEEISESLRGMHDVLTEREPEVDENNDLVFMLTKQMVNRSLQRFGFQI